MDAIEAQAHLVTVIAELTMLQQAMDGGHPTDLHHETMGDPDWLAARIGAAIACLEGRAVLHRADVYYRGQIQLWPAEGTITRVSFRGEPYLISGCTLIEDESGPPAPGK